MTDSNTTAQRKKKAAPASSSSAPYPSASSPSPSSPSIPVRSTVDEINHGTHRGAETHVHAPSSATSTEAQTGSNQYTVAGHAADIPMEAVEVDDSSDDEQIEILLQSLGKLLTKKRRVQGQTSTNSTASVLPNAPKRQQSFFKEDIGDLSRLTKLKLPSLTQDHSFIEASLSTM